MLLFFAKYAQKKIKYPLYTFFHWRIMYKEDIAM